MLAPWCSSSGSQEMAAQARIRVIELSQEPITGATARLARLPTARLAPLHSTRRLRDDHRQQLGLTAHVVADRHRPQVHLFGQRTHVESAGAVAIQDADGGVDDARSALLRCDSR
ncbi:hypothetical protein A5766_15170 [Gordonia sp. 852002-51296_SCH5728562-b]|nr:hypothetical protein A5766_15170 [Gordonia sp. 852002-51296_SCH5728562-b]